MSLQTSSLISKTFSFQDIRNQLSKSKILELPKQKSFDKYQYQASVTLTLTEHSHSSEVRA